MGQKTEISWTDATWNPIRGCSMAPGSENGGCKNCYAARLHARNLPSLMSPMTGKPLARILDSGPRWTGEVALIEKAMYLPLHWKKPKRIFVNSQSDLFHEELDFHDILRIYLIMMTAHWHIFQVLTKRPARAREFFLWWDRTFPGHAFPSNVWLGVSVENQATAEARIPILLGIPAKVHFVSAEPLLGPIDLMYPIGMFPEGPPRCCNGADCGCMGLPTEPPLIYEIDLVIVGGESGPGARPMHPDWARSLRDQCKAANVRFFFKQWGNWIPMESDQPSQLPKNHGIPNGSVGPRRVAWVWPDGEFSQCGKTSRFPLPDCLTVNVGKKTAGSLLDGREWKEMPGDAA